MRRRVLRSLLLACVTLSTAGVLPAGMRAGDAEGEAAGERGTPTIIPGQTLTAVAADLDGDGVTEVVRVAAEMEPNGLIHRADLEAWQHQDGRWVPVASRPLERWSADVGDFVRVDAFTDAFGLLAPRLSGVRQLVLAVAVGPANENGSALSVCCVQLMAVTLEAGELELELIHDMALGATSIVALDMDGDGTDELIAEGPGGPGSVQRADIQRRYATALRWDGSEVEAQEVEIGATSESGPGIVVGDSDGEPGDDVIFSMDDGALTRAALDDTGHLVLETSTWTGQGRGMGWILGSASGYVVAQAPEDLEVWRWPRGGTREVIASGLTTPLTSTALVAAGSSAVVMETVFPIGGGPGTETVVRRLPDLEPAARLSLTDVAAAAWEISNAAAGRFERAPSAYPYFGPVPWDDEGVAAYAAMGTLVTVHPDGRVETRPMGTLASTYPIDRAGPEDAWLLTGRDLWADPRRVSLFPMVHAGAGGLTIARAEEALAPEDPSEVSISLVDVPLGMWRGEERPFADDTGVVATVDATPGSSVVASMDDGSAESVTHDGTTTIVVLRPPRNRTSTAEVRSTVLVVTPLGHAYVEAWDVVVVRESPEIEAEAETRFGALQATVSGRASAGAMVLVAGREVTPDSGGRFSVAVDAPIWPTDIRVVARDPLGNEAGETVSVVGGVDYRRWPWVPIVATVTAAAGLTMYLRTPRRTTRETADDADSDVRLEELDPDPT